MNCFLVLVFIYKITVLATLLLRIKPKTAVKICRSLSVALQVVVELEY